VKHDPALTQLLLLHARDGDQEGAIAEYPEALVLEQKARVIDEGLASGKVIRDGFHLRWVKNFKLTTAGHRWLEQKERKSRTLPARAESPPKSNVRIFISHSSADIALAEALTHLLEPALRLERDAIRCTSVIGYSLPTGVRIDDQLRFEIEQSEVLVALITEISLSSTYVLFELGARWVLRKPLFPLLARGLRGTDLKEPLQALAAARCDKRGDILNFVETLSATLSLATTRPTAYERALVKLLAASQTPARTVSQPPKRATVETLPLSAYEIFALQAIFEGCTGPYVEQIISDSLGVTNARAHQSLESIRRKGLVTCSVGKDGEIEYSQTEQGLAWLASNTRGRDAQ
jgi:hypothetical protein